MPVKTTGTWLRNTEQMFVKLWEMKIDKKRNCTLMLTEGKQLLKCLYLAMQ